MQPALPHRHLIDVDSFLFFSLLSRLKVALEAARGLAEFWGFREAMDGRPKAEAEGPRSSVGLVAASLQSHLSKHNATSDFNLIPICRACVRLGKVLVLRYDSPLLYVCN